MTYYPRSAYGGTNPNAGMPANGDTGAWGGYAWPNCPPSSLNGTTDYTTKFGQRLQVVLRAEVVELAELMFAIADKHDYLLYGYNDGEYWGPWGAECRSVSGTSTPSGHSKNLSMDWNAPYNPYSYTFQSDMPPAMVADIEACGWYWGGRYEGQKYDAMHYGYAYTPGDVAGHVAKAKNILGDSSSGGDWFDMATKDELAAVVWEQINRPEYLDAVATTVWTKTVSDRRANDLLNSAAVNAEWNNTGITELPVRVWTQPITGNEPDQLANHLLAQAAACGG